MANEKTTRSPIGANESQGGKKAGGCDSGREGILGATHQKPGLAAGDNGK